MIDTEEKPKKKRHRDLFNKANDYNYYYDEEYDDEEDESEDDVQVYHE